MSRRAGQKGVVKLEDDELFKQIGGQLDANFDYSQWQRTEGSKPSMSRPPPPKPRKLTDTPATNKTAFTVSSGGQGDYTCKHGHHGKSKVKKETVMERVDREKKEEHMKILQLRIRNRRQTIEEYQKRRKQLLQDNMKLRDEIENDEKHSHDEVKKLLRKYEKFRGGITTLNDKFMDEFSSAKKSFEKTKLKVGVDLAALEKQVSVVDDRLRERQAQLHVLMNYKDKEYPVKALRIAELQKQIDDLKVSNSEGEQELQHVVDTEIDKYRKRDNAVQSELMQNVMKDALDKMHPSLKDMAMQNAVMSKEVEFHTKELVELQESIDALDVEVKHLLASPKTNLRQQLFPEFFPTAEKCTPDMEVVLDIPTQEWLPI